MSLYAAHYFETFGRCCKCNELQSVSESKVFPIVWTGFMGYCVFEEPRLKGPWKFSRSNHTRKREHRWDYLANCLIPPWIWGFYHIPGKAGQFQGIFKWFSLKKQTSKQKPRTYINTKFLPVVLQSTVCTSCSLSLCGSFRQTSVLFVASL